jgi:hypothetical protein
MADGWISMIDGAMVRSHNKSFAILPPQMKEDGIKEQGIPYAMIVEE